MTLSAHLLSSTIINFFLIADVQILATEWLPPFWPFGLDYVGFNEFWPASEAISDRLVASIYMHIRLNLHIKMKK